jgi:hypothetical protein
MAELRAELFEPLVYPLVTKPGVVTAFLGMRGLLLLGFVRRLPANTTASGHS